MIASLALLAIALAALATGLAAVNAVALRRSHGGMPLADTLVSILIPARDEEANIEHALAAARASRGVDVEILVMDDGSRDATPEIVRRHASEDPRVRLLTAPPLPQGWAGKTHACQRLAESARGRYLLFIDADVRLGPRAVAALVAAAESSGAALVSGVPRQIMRSLGELLTVPMIAFLLLAYLPIPIMRSSARPSLGAAVGQLVLARRDAYFAVGGHGAVRTSLHDGLKLARCMRERSFNTDLIDAGRIASCRMYGGFKEAWSGFMKNAREGMATPLALPVWTVLLAGGHLLPPVLVAVALLTGASLLLPLLALALSLLGRTVVTLRTGESLWTIPLHPATVTTALAIQWTALLRPRRGGGTLWKGRSYEPA